MAKHRSFNVRDALMTYLDALATRRSRDPSRTCSAPNEKYCLLETCSSHGPHADRSQARKSWAPISICSVYSSSTPTVPFSTADLLYNSEGRGDEYGNNEFYNRDKEKVRSRDFDIAANRRPTSRSDTKRSFSLDKVSVDREKEDSRGLPNCFPPSKPATSLLRSNGVRNSLLRGRDPDELVAMGTIWSPNAQQRNTSTSGSNTNSGSGKSLGVTASSQACSIQPRRMPNVTTTTRQILVQQAGAPPPTASRPPASREVEPKYADPIPGAPGPFQQRIMELASLEGETVRWERTRKIKKKPKPEKDS